MVFILYHYTILVTLTVLFVLTLVESLTELNVSFSCLCSPQGPPRQLIHLDPQTHAQLQQMDPQQRALFIQKIQKQRQIILQRQLQVCTSQIACSQCVCVDLVMCYSPCSQECNFIPSFLLLKCGSGQIIVESVKVVTATYMLFSLTSIGMFRRKQGAKISLTLSCTT